MNLIIIVIIAKEVKPCFKLYYITFDLFDYGTTDIINIYKLTEILCIAGITL